MKNFFYSLQEFTISFILEFENIPNRKFYQIRGSFDVRDTIDALNSSLFKKKKLTWYFYYYRIKFVRTKIINSKL